MKYKTKNKILVAINVCFLKLISTFVTLKAIIPRLHIIIYRMNAGIYIHIPFCKSRCIYCGFYSTIKEELRPRYINAIIKELHLRRNELNETCDNNSISRINTIYIGGGTPSVLQAEEIGRILQEIRDLYPGNPSEITVEVNPDDVSTPLIKKLKSYGVNRISMGVQTFNDNRLRFINRRHTASQASAAMRIIREAGIDNVSLDLMFGFPGETLEEWNKDIAKAIELNPSHISAYSLMYEEGTALYKMLETGKIKEIDDETSLKMYIMLIDTLKANGYEHYEISNFAKLGFRSIHNSSYWHDIPYLGLGASAHSYLKSKRSWNVSNIFSYIEKIERDILPSEQEIIDDDTHYNDLITTAMRTVEGLDLCSLKPKYRKYAIKCAQTDISAGLLSMSDNRIRLTRRGLFVSDMVMSDLMMV